MLPILAVSTVLSLSPIIAKYVVEHTPVLLYVCLLFLAAGIGTSIIAWLFHWPPPGAIKQNQVVLLAVTARLIPAVCIAYALQQMPAAVVALFLCAEPVIQIIVAYYLLQEQLVVRQVAAILIGTVGMVMAVGGTVLSCDLQLPLRAYVALIVGIVSGRCGWVLVMRFVRMHHQHTLTFNGILMLISGLLLFPFIVWHYSFACITPTMILLIMSAAAIEVLGYAWWTALSRHYTAGYISFAALVTPLMTMIFAMVLLGETMELVVIPSLLIIVAAMRLYWPNEALTDF